MSKKAAAVETRVDPRVRRTRKLIEDAFNELMLQKSFEEITVLDVTERAMVNRATFYAHYADKYALLDRTMHDSFERQLTSNLPENAGLDAASVRSLILAVCGFTGHVSSQCQRMQRQFEPLVETQIKEIMREIILGWLRRAETASRGAVAPELAATVASWSIYGAAMQWSKGKRKVPAETFADQLLPLVMGSLGVGASRGKR